MKKHAIAVMMIAVFSESGPRLDVFGVGIGSYG